MQQQIKYKINEKSILGKYEIVIPVYKFKNQYREESILVSANKKGYTMYVVKSTGWSTLNFEELRLKFKALREMTEEELLKPIMVMN